MGEAEEEEPLIIADKGEEEPLIIADKGEEEPLRAGDEDVGVEEDTEAVIVAAMLEVSASLGCI